MIPKEKLAAACFAENAQLFGNAKTQAEKYNLYTGLRAMAETIESLSLHAHTLERQLNSMEKKLSELSRR